MSHKQRVQHILEAIKKLENRVNGLTREEFAADDILADSIIYQLIIIGEAVNQLNQKIKERYPDIPWQAIGGLRNFLTHESHSVDLNLVWQTVQQNLPGLKKTLQKELRKPERGGGVEQMYIQEGGTPVLISLSTGAGKKLYNKKLPRIKGVSFHSVLKARKRDRNESLGMIDTTFGLEIGPDIINAIQALYSHPPKLVFWLGIICQSVSRVECDKIIKKIYNQIGGLPDNWVWEMKQKIQNEDYQHWTILLNGVKGVGPQRKEKIKQRFSSLSELQQGGLKGLQEIDGIGEIVAQRIMEELS